MSFCLIKDVSNVTFLYVGVFETEDDELDKAALGKGCQNQRFTTNGQENQIARKLVYAVSLELRSTIELGSSIPKFGGNT